MSSFVVIDLTLDDNEQPGSSGSGRSNTKLTRKKIIKFQLDAPSDAQPIKAPKQEVLRCLKALSVAELEEQTWP